MHKAAQRTGITLIIITVIVILGVWLNSSVSGRWLKAQLAWPSSTGACYREDNTCYSSITAAQCGKSPGVNKRVFIPNRTCAPAPFKLISTSRWTTLSNYVTEELKSSWEEQSSAARASAGQRCQQTLLDAVYGLNNSRGEIDGNKICDIAMASPYAQIIEYPQVTDTWMYPRWTSPDPPPRGNWGTYSYVAACSMVVRCNQHASATPTPSPSPYAAPSPTATSMLTPIIILPQTITPTPSR